MRDTERARQGAWPRTLMVTLARGAALGGLAGTVQVPFSQVVGLTLRRRERSDVAPRLVRRAAERLGHEPSRPERWTLAMVFHFGYAAFWGTLFTLLRATRAGRRPPWWLAGGALGGVLYTAAFSRIGGGPLIGSERHPDAREWREMVIEWAAALSFALTLAYAEQRTAGQADRGGDDDRHE